MNKRSRPRLYTSTTFKVVVGLFYAASFLLGVFPEIVYSDQIGLEHISWGLAAGAGIAIVALTKQCNVWALFIIGFIQPLFVILRSVIEIPEVLRLGLSLVPPLRVGAACAAGGWVVSLVRSGPKVDVFSWSDCRKWMMPAWNAVTRVERVESLFKTLLTAATFLLGILNLLWRP